MFEEKVWALASTKCAGCHLPQGVAQQRGATFILEKDILPHDDLISHNLAQFRAHSGPVDGVPKYISKALGINHGGGTIVTEGFTEHENLLEFQESLERPEEEIECDELDLDPMRDVTLLSPKETLRKASIMLAGRVPTDEEFKRLEGLSESAALEKIQSLLQKDIMKGDAFHDWIKYAWNEILMMRGLWVYDPVDVSNVLSVVDTATKLWAVIECDRYSFRGDSTPLWKRFGYTSETPCKDEHRVSFRKRHVRMRLAWSLIEEPLELIAWIVTNDRPFTEILTSDVAMMNYYSSVAHFGSALPKDNPYIKDYGDELKMEPSHRDFPPGSKVPELHQFRPVRQLTLKIGLDRDKKEFYYRSTSNPIPRSGILSAQQFLLRYPTTDTNVNRHRAWAFLNTFLGQDILALADFRGDPAKAELDSDQPTIDNPQCNVCHKVMDPIAGLFQDYNERATFGPSDTWPPRSQPKMLDAGSSLLGPGGKNQPYDKKSDTLPLEWLAQMTVKDERFAAQMVRHAFVQLTRTEPIASHPTHPEWAARKFAYQVQSDFLRSLAAEFQQRDFNMKWLLSTIITSPWYRIDGLQSPAVVADPIQRASLAELGSGNVLLTPEDLMRKIEAILQRPWVYQTSFLLSQGRGYDFHYIDDIYRDMYGGIDFFNNVERLTEPNSVIASGSRRIAYELGCGSVAQDFAIPAKNRALFAHLEPRDTLTSAPQGVRDTVRHLIERLWGVSNPDRQSLEQIVSLFDQVQREGKAQIGATVKSSLLDACQATKMFAGQQGPFTPITHDPDYTLRAWAAVVSFLALDPQFLYRW